MVQLLLLFSVQLCHFFSYAGGVLVSLSNQPFFTVIDRYIAAIQQTITSKTPEEYLS